MLSWFFFPYFFLGLSSSFISIVLSQLTSSNVFLVWNGLPSRPNWSFLKFLRTTPLQPLHILPEVHCTHLPLDWEISSVVSAAVLKLALHTFQWRTVGTVGVPFVRSGTWPVLSSASSQMDVGNTHVLGMLMCCPLLLIFWHSHRYFMMCHKCLLFTFINSLLCVFLMWEFWKNQKLCCYCCLRISRFLSNIIHMCLMGNLKLQRVSGLLLAINWGLKPWQTALLITRVYCHCK